MTRFALAATLFLVVTPAVRVGSICSNSPKAEFPTILDSDNIHDVCDQDRCLGVGGQKPCAVFSALATEVNNTRRDRPIGAPSSDVAVTAANSVWQSMLNPSRSIRPASAR